MEKITREEFERYNGLRSPIVKEALSLEVGEGLKIGFNEWSGNLSPTSSIVATAKRYGMKFRTHIDKQGEFWSVLRVQ